MIQEILSNTIYLSPFRIPNFSAIKKAEAEAFSLEVEEEYIAHGGYTQDEIIELNIDFGYWTEDKGKELEKLLKEIQYAKGMYFEDFFRASKREQHLRAINNGIKRVNALILDKNHLFEYSAEYAKEEAYWTFLFSEHESPAMFYRKYASWKLHDDKVRSLYFNHKWRSIWASCKEPYGIFGIHSNQLNDNQISLLYWSKIYDNIQESQEPPHPAMMQDTIAIDGWFIKQSKNKDSKGQNENKATEVFKMAKNKKEKDEILAMNSIEGQRVIKSRANDLKQNSELDEFHFSHVKQDLAMKFNELNSRRN
jgi:hypothetical protein